MSNRKKPTWAKLKATRTNTRVSTDIVLDAAAAAEADRLGAELDSLGDDAPAELAKQVRELEQQAAASRVTFTFEGVSRSAYQQLCDEHPASPEDQAAGARFGPGFMPALLAASCVQPAELRGDVDEWTEIHDEWSNGMTTRLVGACLSANAGVAAVPKSSRASAILARTGSATS